MDSNAMQDENVKVQTTPRSGRLVILVSLFLAVAMMVFVGPGCWSLVFGRPIPAEARRYALEGDTIVAALHRYKNEVGLWPELLDDLLPKFVERIPSGWTYTYRPESASPWRVSRDLSDGEHVWLTTTDPCWVVGLHGRGDRQIKNRPAPRVELPAVLADVRTATILAEFDRRIERTPCDIWSRMGQISLLVRLGRTEQAGSACDKMIALCPDMRWPIVVRTQLLIEQNKAGDAIKEYAVWCDAHPGLASCWHLSLLYRQAGDRESALAALSEMSRCDFKYDPEDGYGPPFLVYDAAAYAYMNEQHDLVLALYSRYPPDWKGCSDAMRAIAMLTLKDFDGADRCVQRVLDSKANTDWVTDFASIQRAVQQRDVTYRHRGLAPPLVKADLLIDYK